MPKRICAINLPAGKKACTVFSAFQSNFVELVLCLAGRISTNTSVRCSIVNTACAFDMFLISSSLKAFASWQHHVSDPNLYKTKN